MREGLSAVLCPSNIEPSQVRTPPSSRIDIRMVGALQARMQGCQVRASAQLCRIIRAVQHMSATMHMAHYLRHGTAAFMQPPPLQCLHLELPPGQPRAQLGPYISKRCPMPC